MQRMELIKSWKLLVPKILSTFNMFQREESNIINIVFYQGKSLKSPLEYERTNDSKIHSDAEQTSRNCDTGIFFVKEAEPSGEVSPR